MTRNREDCPAGITGYAVTIWEATGRLGAELDAVEGFVIDMNYTLNHLTRAELMRDALAAEAELVRTGEIEAIQCAC
jgi:hypothetical protein